jgi:predicted membrane protein
VTLGLVGAGATFGALAGGMALALAMLISAPDMSGFGFLVGGLLGAPLGAVIGPILALALLRRVPLGRVFLGLSLGTVVGGVVGWVMSLYPMQPLMGLAGSFIGCLSAAVMLRFRTQPEPETDD